MNRHVPSRVVFPAARVAAILLAALAPTSCLSFGPGEEATVVYYQLTASPSEWSGGSLPATVALKPFTASEALDPEGVRYRTSDVEGGYWTDDRWAEPAAAMVRGVLQRQLDASGLFRRVNSMEGAGFADVLIGGEVHRLEEEDRGSEWFAVFEVTIEVSKGTDGSVIYSRRFYEEERCGDRTVREVVRALNRAATRVVEKLRSDLHGTLRGGYR